jgi:hypothetical protein
VGGASSPPPAASSPPPAATRSVRSLPRLLPPALGLRRVGSPPWGHLRRGLRRRPPCPPRHRIARGAKRSWLSSGSSPGLAPSAVVARCANRPGRLGHRLLAPSIRRCGSAAREFMRRRRGSGGRRPSSRAVLWELCRLVSGGEEASARALLAEDYIPRLQADLGSAAVDWHRS